MRENHLIAYPDLTDRSYAELVSLACRRAVVTGGAAGLRRQIFSRRLDAGASVLIGDLCPTAAENTAGELSGQGRRALGALADVAIRELGGIDVWVNNAGVYPRGSILDIATPPGDGSWPSTSTAPTMALAQPRDAWRTPARAA